MSPPKEVRATKRADGTWMYSFIFEDGTAAGELIEAQAINVMKMAGVEDPEDMLSKARRLAAQ